MLSLLHSWLWYTILAVTLLMPLLWRLSGSFRYFVRISGVYFMVFASGFVVFPFVLPWPFDPTNYRTVARIFLAMTDWLNIKWELREKKYLELDEPCVVVVNHQSSIDLVGMMHFIPDRCVVLIKRELMFIGPFGISAALSGSIFVDRFNPGSARSVMDKTVKYIKDQKIKLWVFPEGTRNHETEEFLPFKKGAFHVAVQAQIPIVPLVFSSYSPFYSKNDRRFNSDGYVICEALPAIRTEGLGSEDVTKLSEDTREKMLKVFQRISPEAKQKYESGQI